jgi:hypothetical protein
MTLSAYLLLAALILHGAAAVYAFWYIRCLEERVADLSTILEGDRWYSEAPDKTRIRRERSESLAGFRVSGVRASPANRLRTKRSAIFSGPRKGIVSSGALEHLRIAKQAKILNIGTLGHGRSKR